MTAHRINGLGYVTHPCAELDELMREVSAYLAAVDTFRAEGCAPSWVDHNRPGADLAERLECYSVRA